MLDALGRLPSLCAGDRSLSRAIAISPFVPTACGKLAAPAHLYDPRIPELVELLDVNNSFPTAPFDDDVTLGILASLGMRSTVTQTAVMDAAMTAERLGDVDGDVYDPVGAAERARLALFARRGLAPPVAHARRLSSPQQAESTAARRS